MAKYVRKTSDPTKPDPKKKKKKLSEMTEAERKAQSYSKYASVVNDELKSGRKRTDTTDAKPKGLRRVLSPAQKAMQKTVSGAKQLSAERKAHEKEVEAAGGKSAYIAKASKSQQERKKNIVRIGTTNYDKRIPRHAALIAQEEKRKKKN